MDYSEISSQTRVLHVSRTLRLYIAGDSLQEIRLRPVSKAIFLLYLRHPEGISFKDLWTFRRELSDLYGMVSRADDMDRLNTVLDNMLYGFNVMSVNCTRLRHELERYLDVDELEEFRIKGAQGAPKYISVDRSRVVWNSSAGRP